MRNPLAIKFMMFMLMMFMVCLVTDVVYGEKEVRCIEREREALLRFKAAIVDRYGMLSSWTTPHCCQWQGIRCSNLTGHILMLDLHGEVHEEISFDFYLEFMSERFISGEIHKSLMELSQLQYLNLSSNSFPDSNIPEFLGSLSNLRYLDLSS
ncbi:receptor-like protein EIX2, partial [Vigna umbellata]|uniref:receptor-like protein EIX2 n=1 Tax=Vigna umbellata TaxID=87088 RepID=UPI001F5E4461